jgi:ankyrin repeat protein
MSFLSFYNEQHGKGNEAVLNLIAKEDWEKTDFAARTDPLALHWKVTVPGFFDGQVTSKVLPIHIACSKRAPASVVATFSHIHPRGLMTAESAYKRLPLHIACMSRAPVDTIVKLIELKSGAAKKKDALGRLPIHYACKDPRLDTVVAHLLRVYPGSTKVADKQGFLPIHVACRCGMSVAIIRVLLKSAPSTIKKKTKKGSSPYMCVRLTKALHKEDLLELLRKIERDGSDSSGTEDTGMSSRTFLKSR